MILLRGDFNGLWPTDDGETLLCLSHRETVQSWNGEDLEPAEGMEAIAMDEDTDRDGNRDDLVAQGIVIRSPEWLQCRGSKWSLRIDENGIRNQSKIPVVS